MSELDVFVTRVRGRGLGRQRSVLCVSAAPRDRALLRAANLLVDERPLAEVEPHAVDGVWFGRRADVDAASLAAAFRSVHHGFVRAPYLDDRDTVELLLEKADFHVVDESPAALVAWTKIVTPRIGTSAAIFDAEGRVLLTERADGRGWCMPGGFADPHEAPWDAIVREVREETGLKVAVDSLLGIYAVPANRLTAHAFICSVLGGELEVTDETLAVGWFAEHTLPAPFFPTHVTRLRDAFALRRGDLAAPILRTMQP